MPLQAKPIGGQLKATPPPPPKYAKIKAKLDTGYNELKIKSSDLQANARFHRGENFRRLKVSWNLVVRAIAIDHTRVGILWFVPGQWIGGCLARPGH